MRNNILISMLLVTGLLISAILVGAAPAKSAPPLQEPTPDPNLSIGDHYCISCHGQQGLIYTLEDGSVFAAVKIAEGHEIVH